MLKLIKIIMHIIILYGIYLIGNWIQVALNLFIPGSVIGMVLLFIVLMTNIIKVTWIEEGSKLIINHLTLFFIPATVGVMNYFELFKGNGFLLVLIALLSTALVMALSGVISQWLMRRKEVPHDE
ncbi:holin-like protein [Virgibacillus halotolerans]|uniref:CidA/LrgA family protein n=1 Tax=Virgibacillus halotolerans TaxID=1071053 RepID=UPI00196014EA|nr:CidA/LrgA family protein [Virgibacillus halotolerans]MBM7600854.1 holin-like protein [Virgibacillus halotolerans]